MLSCDEGVERPSLLIQIYSPDDDFKLALVVTPRQGLIPLFK